MTDLDIPRVSVKWDDLNLSPNILSPGQFAMMTLVSDFEPTEVVASTTFTFSSDVGSQLTYVMPADYFQPVPEPSSVLLLATGIIGLTFFQRRFQRRQSGIVSFRRRSAASATVT